jgi:hypothetical protein
MSDRLGRKLRRLLSPCGEDLMIGELLEVLRQRRGHFPFVCWRECWMWLRWAVGGGEVGGGRDQRRDFAIPLKELLWVVVVVSHGHGRKLSTDNRIYKPQSQAKYASLSDDVTICLPCNQCRRSIVMLWPVSMLSMLAIGDELLQKVCHEVHLSQVLSRLPPGREEPALEELFVDTDWMFALSRVSQPGRALANQNSGLELAFACLK